MINVYDDDACRIMSIAKMGVLRSLWEERNRINQEKAVCLVMFKFGTLDANNQLMIQY